MINLIQELIVNKVDVFTQLLSALLQGAVLYYIGVHLYNYAVKGRSNLLTFSLLPPIGLVIVTVISDNVALSLGMVGALSIIRFRHPVKTPSELVLYFLLLTLGISMSVKSEYSWILFSICLAVIFSIEPVSKLLKLGLNRRDGGNDEYIVEIRLKSPIYLKEFGVEDSCLLAEYITLEGAVYLLSFDRYEDIRPTASDVNGIEGFLSFNIDRKIAS
jgi:hypothetical protein